MRMTSDRQRQRVQVTCVRSLSDSARLTGNLLQRELRVMGRQMADHSTGALPQVMKFTGEIEVSDRKRMKPRRGLVQEDGSGQNAHPVGNERRG